MSGLQTRDRSRIVLVPVDDPGVLLDIDKYGPEVEVVAPEVLRREVVERLRAAARVYES